MDGGARAIARAKWKQSVVRGLCLFHPIFDSRNRALCSEKGVD